MRTCIQLFSSLASITGHDGKGFVRTGLPPRIARAVPAVDLAGDFAKLFPLDASPAATPAALPKKSRRVSLVFIIPPEDHGFECSFARNGPLPKNVSSSFISSAEFRNCFMNLTNDGLLDRGCKWPRLPVVDHSPASLISALFEDPQRWNIGKNVVAVTRNPKVLRPQFPFEPQVVINHTFACKRDQGEALAKLPNFK